MKKLSLIVSLAAAAVVFTACGGGGGGGYVPPPPPPPPGPAVAVVYIDDINGIGEPNIPYYCDSGSGVTDGTGALYYVPGDVCDVDLYGYNGYLSYPLFIDDVDGFGIPNIPFACSSGWNGATYGDGSFEYAMDDYCTFYF